MELSAIDLHDLTQEIISDVKEVLEQCGEVDWIEGDANELMDIAYYTNKFRAMAPEDAAEIFMGLFEEDSVEMEPFIKAALENLNSWDKFEAMLEEEPGINEWL